MPLALISGASTGIGRATTLRLAASGWTVLAGVRKIEDGEKLVAAAGEQVGDGRPTGAGRVVPVVLDVTDASQIAQAVERVDEHAGGSGLDALVNNAGIGGVSGPLELIPVDDLRRQLEVNVLGHLAVTQALLPALRGARGRGRIVFVSSLGGRVTVPYSAPYAASKHALEAIGDALRAELRSSKVKVVLVEPGSVATPIWAKTGAEADQVKVPPELQSQYGHVPEAFAKTLRNTESRGIPPEQVAETIERALTTTRPRARYLVGRDAWGIVIGHAVLPTRLFDRIVMRALGM